MRKFLIFMWMPLLALYANASSWERATTIQTGDVVVLAVDNGSFSAELTGISTTSTKYGTYSQYETIPAAQFPLQVVEGTDDGSYAFQTDDGRFLYWQSGNTLNLTASLSENSSWTVSFDDAGIAYIKNVTDPSRVIRWNNNSNAYRFACYTSAQHDVFLWRQADEGEITPPSLTSTQAFIDVLTVEINSSDGIVYYTTDGTDPTTDSKLYDSPFDINQTTTVKAIAVDENGQTSPVATATYTKVEKTKIRDVQQSSSSSSVFIEGVVVAACASGAVIYDGTDYILYYNVNNELWTGEYVRVQGVPATYGGAKQFTSSAVVTEIEDLHIEIDDSPLLLTAEDLISEHDAGVAQRRLVKLNGQFIVSGNYYNVSVEGNTDVLASILKPNEDYSSFDGQEVTVIGYEMYVTGKYVYFVATEVNMASSPDLTVENLTVTSSVFNPGETIDLSWTVSNIGEKETLDGFTEYIYLENEDSTNVRRIATLQYDGVIQSWGTVSRNASVTLPYFLGIDGDAWIRVRVAPYGDTGEPESLQKNNSVRTANSVQVEKLLKLVCDYETTDENEVSEIGFRLSRSGNWDEEQTFEIDATADSRVSLPSSITIEKGQSEAYFYATITNDELLQDEEATTINVNVEGNGYDAVTASFILNDDEMADLEVEASDYKVNEGESFQLTIKTNRPSDNPVEVTLTCDYAKYFKFPSQVNIPAGQSSVVVEVTAVDDDVPNLDIDVLFTVSAPHHVQDEAGVILYDNDIPTLQLTLTPDKVSESSGVQAVTAVLKRTDNLNSKIILHISDDAEGGLYYDNKTVEMPKGVSEVYFTFGPVDNALNEGDRSYNITAAVYISACSCSASGESAGAVSAQLTVLDDDGATITLSATDGTLIEGGTTTVTVHRNTTTDENLMVMLSSDNDVALEYEHTVTIPAGQEEVDVAITAKKNSLTGDTKTVVFTAEADGFGTGTCWVMLTDQSLPDAIIDAVVVEKNEAEVGENILVSVTVKNVGNESLPEMTCVKLYKMDTNDLVATMYTTTDIPVGQSETFKRMFTLPELVGTYKLYAVVNENHEVKETIFTNNTSEVVEIKAAAPFTATLHTDKEVYAQGEKIIIEGQLQGSRTANQDVEIYMINDGARQTLSATSLADGSFSAEWQLAQFESGHFIVGACYPEEGGEIEMDWFDVYGLKRTDNAVIYCDVTLDDTYDGTIALQNTSVLALTGVEVEILSKPENAEVVLDIPSTISGNEKTQLNYQIKGTAVSLQNEWSDINAIVKTAQGVSVNVLFKYYCRNKTAMLATDQQNIKTTMVKGQTREYPMILTNFGKGNSGNISLVLPDFMKCASGNNVAPLSQNDSTTIILLLTPKDEMQLNVPVEGSFGVVCENGEGLTINFNITPVSEEKGTLKVDVMDEYTYYTAEAPHLKDAEVVVKNPVTGAVVAQGKTSSDGTFTADIIEGYYQLNVTAENHSSYTANIIVDPGTVTVKNVNLSVDAISVTWEVEETEVQDEYQIVTTLKYETNVPVPVVELITPERIDADKLSSGESLIFYALMTNKGLITAKETKLILPENTSELTFEALTQYEDLTIAPQQSVRIPIKVTKINDGETKLRKAPAKNGSSCAGSVGTLYSWDCGTDRKWHTYSNALQWGSCGYGTLFGGGGGPGTIIAGGTPPILQITNKPNNIGPSDPVVAQYSSLISGLYTSSSSDEGCEPCQNRFLLTMIECSKKHVPIIKDVWGIVEWIKDPAGQAKEYAKDKIIDLANDMIEKWIPVYGLIRKIIGWKEVYDDCIKPLLGECTMGESVKSRIGNNNVNSGYPSYIVEYQNTLSMLVSAIDAQQNIVYEYFGDEKWIYADPTELYAFLEEFTKYLNGNADLNEVKSKKPQSVSESMYNVFIERWINSMNGNDDANVLDLEKVNESNLVIKHVEEYVIEHGYTTAVEMFEDAEQKVMENLNLAAKSVCSSVTLQFTQNMVMTRQAFRGMLTVFNGNETTDMENIKLTLNITSENGDVDTSREFQINTEEITGFNGEPDLQSGWSLQADNTGRATILFIPSKYAATDEPVDYYFGGTLTYVDPFTGLEVTRELYPVTLTVKPSPVIDLNYFVQRDVFGDDALTKDVIEPVIPAEFAVVVNNKGKGKAENLRMITSQPVIIENEKGLLVNFNIASSQLNGNDANLSFGKTVANEFGSLEPNSQAYAQWWIESSLLGHFASYDIEASHLTSYGNENLSLLDKVTIHELIHGFTVNGDDGLTIRGFLVNDIVDANDLPDHVYFSDATDETVDIADSSTLTLNDEWQYILSVNGKIGWTYGCLPDPTNGEKKIASVIRLSDHKEIPADNIWQTYCTLIDGQEPEYENNIHFIIDLTAETESYLITFEESPETWLTVDAFYGLPEDNTYITEPLQNVTVSFNKPVDDSTFTTEDITLYCAGQNVNVADITIEKLSDTEFNINLNGVNQEDGYYVLNVQASGIIDAEGFSGVDGKQCAWTQLSDGTMSYPDITVSEYDDNSDVLDQYDGEVCNVSVLRTIKFGSYNTITLPFDVDAETMKAVFGNEVKLKEMVNSTFNDNELTFIFESAESMEAGKPYLIKVEQNVINPVFNAVLIKNSETVSKSEYADFVPVFSPTMLTDGDEKVVFLGADNKLYFPSHSTESMPGLRAYFILSENSDNIKGFNMDIDDQPTVIHLIMHENERIRNGIFNIAGQKVEKPLNKGIYIINGKKILVQ